ncbi:uncharacterized mitochondrial protein-like protein [Tanacetum coccineum]|uniref:Uncharacterized mitochondrial protein-like protein n=1 Tax=Tanacetum coccineum TaxID=301880 RepID=A0ABQ5E7S8_9ASTR
MSRKLGLKCSTSKCGSKPNGNIRNDRISAKHIWTHEEISRSTFLGCPDCSLVSGLRMFQTHDRESLSAHELYLLGSDFLRTKDEAPEAIIKCIKNIQVRLNATVRNVQTDNGTEFVNQTIHEFYENVGISHQTSVARTPQQNGVVKRQNQTLVEAARAIDDWDHLFQPMFDEYFTPPSIVVSLVQEAAAPRAVLLADSLVSTSIDQDAPSPSTPSTHEQEQSPTISQGFEESPKTPIFHDDPLNESPHDESSYQGSSSNIRQTYTLFEHLGRWTKDHPIANVIGNPSRSVSTRKQLQTNTMWCYFDALLTSVESKNFKQAMTEPLRIDAMQEEIHEFERLKVWELVPCEVDPTLFTRQAGNDLLLVQIYVDDIIFASTNTAMSNEFANQMTTQFKMSMMGQMSFILGLQISQSPRGIFINQSKYASEIVKKYGLHTTDSVDTHLVEKSKLDEDLQGKQIDATLYHGVIGSLMYLTSSRPDLIHAFCLCARYQAKPTEKHLQAVKQIFRYLKGTINMGIW